MGKVAQSLGRISVDMVRVMDNVFSKFVITRKNPLVAAHGRRFVCLLFSSRSGDLNYECGDCIFFPLCHSGNHDNDLGFFGSGNP